MSGLGWFAVGIGSALGAWLRWVLGLTFNPMLPNLPLGTLAANLLGGYLVGLAVSYFSDHAGLPPETRLFVITGFMGGLTTFSTFSAESVTLLGRTQYLWALAHLLAHLGGSLTMTVAGMATYTWLKSH
ncbi:MAG: fluoride efflux transporter CrcB [Betaproteobacteria bacterium]|jgi:camphor resistance protein CrcB|nr:fluoride efflux transporter CrcB [Betaproteobacteria bacterium]